MSGNVRLGYTCINAQLRKTRNITNNSSMIKYAFLVKGTEYAPDLARRNTEALIPILVWNNEKDIKVFRMTSCMFPSAPEYVLKD